MCLNFNVQLTKVCYVFIKKKNVTYKKNIILYYMIFYTK